MTSSSSRGGSTRQWPVCFGTPPNRADTLAVLKWRTQRPRLLRAPAAVPHSLAMTKALYGGDAAAAIAPRALAALRRAHTGGRFDDADAVEQMVRKAIDRLRSRSAIFALHVLRTWLGAWSTAQRAQRGAEPCPWACAPVTLDSQPHQLRCTTLREAIAEALCVTSAEINLHQLGLGDARARPGGRFPLALQALVIAAHAYHKRPRVLVASPEEGRSLAVRSVA